MILPSDKLATLIGILLGPSLGGNTLGDGGGGSNRLRSCALERRTGENFEH